MYNCDCVEYMRSLPDKTFDLAIADPPYGDAAVNEGVSPPPILRKQQKYNRFGGRFDAYKKKVNHSNFVMRTGTYSYKSIGWDEAPQPEFFDELLRVSKVAIIWGGNYFRLPPTRCFLVWKKHIPETFSMAMCEYAWTSMNGNAKLFEAPSLRSATAGRFHPTEKPVALYEWCLRLYGKPGYKVFDPMMGSQSSRVAAWKMGYDYVGCELDKEYYDKGCEWFDRECRGVYKTADGGTMVQGSLFD